MVTPSHSGVGDTLLSVSEYATAVTGKLAVLVFYFFKQYMKYPYEMVYKSQCPPSIEGHSWNIKN